MPTYKEKLDAYNRWRSENPTDYLLAQRRGLLPEIKRMLGIDSGKEPSWRNAMSLKIEKKINQRYGNYLKPIVESFDAQNDSFGELKFIIAPRNNVVIDLDMRSTKEIPHELIEEVSNRLHTIRHEIFQFFGKKVHADNISIKKGKVKHEKIDWAIRHLIKRLEKYYQFQPYMKHYPNTL